MGKLQLKLDWQNNITMQTKDGTITISLEDIHGTTGVILNINAPTTVPIHRSDAHVKR